MIFNVVAYENIQVFSDLFALSVNV